MGPIPRYSPVVDEGVKKPNQTKETNMSVESAGNGSNLSVRFPCIVYPKKPMTSRVVIFHSVKLFFFPLFLISTEMEEILQTTVSQVVSVMVRNV